MPQANNTPQWYPQPANQMAILNFILWFSRFEYALKNGGFHKNFYGYLAPNWKAMKEHLKHTPTPAVLTEALEYLVATPPKKQKINLDWEPVTGSSGWPFLIECLLTIRNNLFHGGKHYPGQLLSPARDVALIQYCQTIMTELYKVAPEHVQILFDTV